METTIIRVFINNLNTNPTYRKHMGEWVDFCEKVEKSPVERDDTRLSTFACNRAAQGGKYSNNIEQQAKSAVRKLWKEWGLKHPEENVSAAEATPAPPEEHHTEGICKRCLGNGRIYIGVSVLTGEEMEVSEEEYDSLPEKAADDPYAAIVRKAIRTCPDCKGFGADEDAEPVEEEPEEERTWDEPIEETPSAVEEVPVEEAPEPAGEKGTSDDSILRRFWDTVLLVPGTSEQEKLSGPLASILAEPSEFEKAASRWMAEKMANEIEDWIGMLEREIASWKADEASKWEELPPEEDADPVFGGFLRRSNQLSKAVRAAYDAAIADAEADIEKCRQLLESLRGEGKEAGHE